MRNAICIIFLKTTYFIRYFILNKSIWFTVPKNAYIWKFNYNHDYIFVIEKGLCELEKNGKPFKVLKKGDSYGEYEVLS